MSKLSKRENIVILKQDKKGGVLLTDNFKYIDKCLALLSAKQFTKTLEIKVQRALQKIKSNFTNGYQIVSFDEKYLFINVPLDQTIDIILRRIYYKHELQLSI